MRRMISLCVGFVFAISTSLKADEGMWLLPLIQKLNIDTMHTLGLRLTSEEIYSLNNSSLKDAIVMFDGGCTGEIVSEEGLLLTNHHCGYDAIQNHSTMEHNYLEDGFWALHKEEELPNPGVTVTFLVRIEDVTDLIIGMIQDTVKEADRQEKIALLTDSIISAATAGTHYNAVVEPMFGGNSYYLFVYEDFRDVRLVGAPPSSIGKFGYDTDNWMWPRHTADFSVFRVYSAPDGTPAAYSRNNVPMKPRHTLPISLKGVDKGEFTMVMGYPGTTQRYMTSFEVRELLNITNPNRIKIRGLRQDILLKDMMADKKVNIQYAAKYSRSSNYWKYSIGQNEGFTKLNVMTLKEQQEHDFTNWVNEDESRKCKYGEALNLIREAVEGRAPYEHVLQYTYECFFSSAEIITFANKANKLYVSLHKDSDEPGRTDSLARELGNAWNDFIREYNADTDRKILPAILKLYRDNVNPSFYPDFYNVIRSKYRNDCDAYSRDLFDKTIFADPDKMDEFLKHPTVKALDKDPAFQAARAALDIYLQTYLSQAMYDEVYERGNRLYIAGLMEMNPEKKFYPDANSTMRMTYGAVQDYYPRDAVRYDFQTTLDGVIEKEVPDNFEFHVPEKLKELYRTQDYGPYGIDGKMPACFLTTNDITGGNSGSPVIDGDGNLLGLAFDGNWEAMSGNIVFEPELQRCICVDIRYVLFIMDKYAGATNLVNEMKIIR